MLDAREAKIIGIKACVEKIGIEFCKKYEANACTSCGIRDNMMFCSVGIDDKPYVIEKNPGKLVLSESGFQYIASCNVDMENGCIKFLECIVP